MNMKWVNTCTVHRSIQTLLSSDYKLNSIGKTVGKSLVLYTQIIVDIISLASKCCIVYRHSLEGASGSNPGGKFGFLDYFFFNKFFQYPFLIRNKFERRQ